MKLLPLIALLALAACGVDGPPISPSTHETPPPGIAVSGEARIGVVSSL
ncbi:argininosuccinate lyase [Paracoccus cavernae]